MARTDATAAPESAPRAPLICAALACIVATLLLAWPALGGAFLVNPHSDQYLAGYAFREFAARSLRMGQGFPLWNSYQFDGMPYVAAMHGDIFYPTFLLRMILPTDIAMTFGFVLHMIGAGFFTFGFLRAAGVRFQSALVGAVAYLLSGTVASYASPGHDGKLFVSALLPAALWALVRAMRDGRRAAWGLLSLVVGLAVLSPHPQLLQYMLLTIGAYALFLAFRPLAVTPDTAQPMFVASKPKLVQLVYALGAVLLGAAIGAIQYLPVAEYVAWSPRSGGKSYEYATSFSFPVEETINAYLPQFSGILDNYWGRNGIHWHSEYAGAAALVLALFAFGGGLINRHRAHGWFWISTLVVSLVWAWGSDTPFYQLVYAIVPGAKYFRAPSMMLFVSAFSIAVLAAFGTERVLAGKATVRLAVGWVVFALSVALIATAGGITGFAMSLFGDTRGDQIAANASNVIVGAWRSALFVALTIGVALATARRQLKTPLAGWLLAAIVSLDLWSVERHYWLFSQRAAVLYADDAVVRYLTAQTQPARVIAIPLSGNTAPNDPFLLGDALMHFGIRGVLGYHGNELGRFQELYGKNDGFQNIANPNFWSLTNARFFYTNAPELPFQGATLVAGPVRNAAGTMTYLYQLPGDHPAAWVAPQIVKLDDASSKATILNPLFDVRRVAIFDSSSHVTARPVSDPLPEVLPVGVRVRRYDPGAIDLTLEGIVPQGSALVVSENFYPGWHAVVDGRDVGVGRVDFTLLGVELPAGAKTVSLRFRSAPYETGKTITQLALVLVVLLTVGGALLDRRRAPTPV